MAPWARQLRYSWVSLGVLFLCLFTTLVRGQSTFQIKLDAPNQIIADGQWVPLRISWPSNLIPPNQAITVRLRDSRGGLTVSRHFAPGTTPPVILALPLVALEELQSEKLAWNIVIQIQGVNGDILQEGVEEIRLDDIKLPSNAPILAGDIPCVFDPLKNEFTPSHSLSAGNLHWPRIVWWWGGGSIVLGVIIWIFLRSVAPFWLLLSWFLVLLLGSCAVIWYLDNQTPTVDEVQKLGNRSLRVVGQLRPWRFTASGTGTAPHPLVNSASEWWSLRGEIELSSTTYRCSYDLPGKYLLWLDLGTVAPAPKNP